MAFAGTQGGASQVQRGHGGGAGGVDGQRRTAKVESVGETIGVGRMRRTWETKSRKHDLRNIGRVGPTRGRNGCDYVEKLRNFERM